MLVLSRKCGEKVVIGENITVTILSTEGGRIRIGIDAPDHIGILRGELVSDRKPADAPNVVLASR